MTPALDLFLIDKYSINIYAFAFICSRLKRQRRFFGQEMSAQDQHSSFEVRILRAFSRSQRGRGG
jgi:hypothetical protein